MDIKEAEAKARKAQARVFRLEEELARARKANGKALEQMLEVVTKTEKETGIRWGYSFDSEGLPVLKKWD